MAIEQHGDTKLEGVSIRSLPKVSLHDHLDGALRPQTIIELADEIGVESLVLRHEPTPGRQDGEVAGHVFGGRR